MQFRLISAELSTAEQSRPGASDVSCVVRNCRTGEFLASEKLRNTNTPRWHESYYLHETSPDDVLEIFLREELVRAADPVVKVFDNTVKDRRLRAGHTKVVVRGPLQKSTYVLDRELGGGCCKVHSNARSQSSICPPRTGESLKDALPGTSVVLSTASVLDSQHTVIGKDSASQMDHVACNARPNVIRAPVASDSKCQSYQSVCGSREGIARSPCCFDCSLSSLLPMSSGDAESRTQLLRLVDEMTFEAALADRLLVKFVVVDPRLPCLSTLLPPNPYKKCINLKYTVGEVKLALKWTWMQFLDALPGDAKPKVENFFESLRSCVTSPGAPKFATWQAYLDSVSHVYPTWKIDMHYVHEIFGSRRQPWNRDHRNARTIFESGALQGAVRVQHAALYGGTGFHTWFGLENIRQKWICETGSLLGGRDFLRLIDFGMRDGRRRKFTYVLMPDKLYMSETGPVVYDIVSKHAVHASAAEEVVYAGELLVREDEMNGVVRHTLVLDNRSGTYIPKAEELPLLREVFVRNFFGVDVDVYEQNHPVLEELRASYL